MFVRKSEKMYEKAHIGRFFTRKKVALFIALSSSFTTFFFTFQKEERERERLIFVERTTGINKSTRRARAQNNETGNT